MKALFKGLLMVVITFAASFISTSGIPETAVLWEQAGITLVGTLIVYFAQSAAMPATSPAGQLNSFDFIKGLLVAIGNFFSAIGADFIIGASFDWKRVATSAISVLAMYILKNAATNPTSLSPSK